MPATLKLDVLKLKLEELSQALNQKAGTITKEIKPEPVQGSKPAAPHQEALSQICPGCRTWVSFDRSQIEPGALFLAHESLIHDSVYTPILFMPSGKALGEGNQDMGEEMGYSTEAANSLDDKSW